jgi:hypothetical protein
MNVTIAYCLAGLSTLTLVVLWFANAHKVLHQKRDAVYKAQEVLRLHQNGYNEKKGRPEEQTAKHMLDTSTQIYEQIKGAYNESLKNPKYSVPGALMGFKNVN